MLTKEIALSLCTSIMGPIKADSRKKIEKYLSHPTRTNWDNIYSIIIRGSGRMTTVWQAVILIDPAFTRTAKMDCNMKTRWAEIPSADTVRKALLMANIPYNKN